ncbi:MAG: hypothetical protein JEZ09_06755 [Salinivirgaceae bacterium]|nr:hypothetical protein [Salinivirgaceae bacterium]
MNYIKYTVFILLFVILSCSPHGNGTKKSQLTKNGVEKEDYLKTIEELNKDFFKNYWEIEKIIVSKLEKEGSEYFIENNCYEILGKFESTLEVYCQICEKLNIDNKGGLLTSYLHLNDIENVKKQYELMQTDEIAFVYKEFYKYEDSGKLLESKYISIKFDKRVEEFANAVFTHINAIEEFIIQEWEGLLPPKTRVMLLYCDGPGPYNSNLNETYLPIKSRSISSSKKEAGGIVHEIFHLVNIQLLGQKCKFDIDWGMNSFKFLDEGYAQLIESKFMNTFNENREGVDEYSKKIVIANSFDFKELKTKWGELFSSSDVKIYYLAYSFACFLEDKYGEEKHKALFLPVANIPENSWLEYVESYFGLTVDDLIEEWKQKLIQ